MPAGPSIPDGSGLKTLTEHQGRRTEPRSRAEDPSRRPEPKTRAEDPKTTQELAEDTAGFAVANTNQIEEPRQRRMEDIRTHYELAYTPTSTNYDGHFRKIEAKIARPKIMVQTRRGY